MGISLGRAGCAPVTAGRLLERWQQDGEAALYERREDNGSVKADEDFFINLNSYCRLRSGRLLFSPAPLSEDKSRLPRRLQGEPQVGFCGLVIENRLHRHGTANGAVAWRKSRVRCIVVRKPGHSECATIASAVAACFILPQRGSCGANSQNNNRTAAQRGLTRNSGFGSLHHTAGPE
jgi:hypothetical protein